MRLNEIYLKDINREVNPAVYADKRDEETVKIEIDEYVFTKEIIKGIYDVLNGIRTKQGSHNGIWINGYYGSGKSHFLKYVCYCLDPIYSERAMDRLLATVDEMKADPEIMLDVTPLEVRDLMRWLKRTEAEVVLFSLENYVKDTDRLKQSFPGILWTELNRLRGYNTINLPFAEYIEQPLDKEGKLEEFRRRLAEANMGKLERALKLDLDRILDIAKELMPGKSYDVVRNDIKNRTMEVGIESFCSELEDYIKSKGDDYRLVFCVDEVSQFIDNRRELLLQLQGLITKFDEVCGNKVWVACTAQQDLSEVVRSSHVKQTEDDYGKIMGRFEVRVSLQGTKPEYITKVRLLEKTPAADQTLGKIFDENKVTLESQFHLPTGYDSFKDRREFIDIYPFVPYQFTLIMQVLNNMVSLGYIDKEKKGTERSIIKMTHTTAKNTQQEELGRLASFDQFYNAVFDGGLTATGLNAIRNAANVVDAYSEDKNFAQRVLHVLFMICNLDESTRTVFAATVDNIVTLLIGNVDEDKRSIKERTEKVLAYLVKSNIIRVIHSTGKSDYYEFYTAAERELVNIISSIDVDGLTISETLWNEYRSYIIPSNKRRFFSRDITVGWHIGERPYLTTNNPDVWVDIELADDRSADDIAYGNMRNKLIFLMTSEFASSDEYDDFIWFCKVNMYRSTHPAANDDYKKAIEDISSRVNQTKTERIEPWLKKLFNKATIISYNQVLKGITNEGQNRYLSALDVHLKQLYPYATYANTDFDLQKRLLQPRDSNEYNLKPLSKPEIEVNEYLQKPHVGSLNLEKICRDFGGVPYGWSNEFTIFVLNELVRRRFWDFTHENKRELSETVKRNIIKNSSKITLVPAEVVDTVLVNDFISAWKDIFIITGSFTTDADMLYNQCAKDQSSKMLTWLRACRRILQRISSYTFAEPMKQALTMLESWEQQTGVKEFFKIVVDERKHAKQLMDDVKRISEFYQRYISGDNSEPYYLSCWDFFKKNEENFTFLPETTKADVEALRNILTDENPWDNIRSYKNAVVTLTKAIDEEKKAVKKEIEEAYHAAFTQLRQEEERRGLKTSVLPDEDATIHVQSQGDSIAVLKLHVGAVSKFISKQTVAIVKAASKPVVKKDENGGEGEKDKHEVSEPEVLHLPVNRVISTTEQVDNYLAELRTAMMKIIEQNKTIIIQ